MKISSRKANQVNSVLVAIRLVLALVFCPQIATADRPKAEHLEFFEKKETGEESDPAANPTRGSEAPDAQER